MCYFIWVNLQYIRLGSIESNTFVKHCPYEETLLIAGYVQQYMLPLLWWSCMSIPSVISALVMLTLRHAA